MTPDEHAAWALDRSLSALYAMRAEMRLIAAGDPSARERSVSMRLRTNPSEAHAEIERLTAEIEQAPERNTVDALRPIYTAQHHARPA